MFSGVSCSFNNCLSVKIDRLWIRFIEFFELQSARGHDSGSLILPFELSCVTKNPQREHLKKATRISGRILLALTTIPRMHISLSMSKVKAFDTRWIQGSHVEALFHVKRSNLNVHFRVREQLLKCFGRNQIEQWKHFLWVIEQLVVDRRCGVRS